MEIQMDNSLSQAKVGDILLNRYLIKTIMSGGMGFVFVAEDTQVQSRTVAIKILPSDHIPDKKARQQFVEEGQALTLSSSMFVVYLYSVVQEGLIYYLIMQYCEGGNLKTRISKGPLSQEQSLIYAIQISLGMRDCQILLPGLIHRDLKPENLLLSSKRDLSSYSTDREEVLQVADFGLVRQYYNIDSIQACQTDGEIRNTHKSVAGTIAYMSPEQIIGSTDLDVTSDIYAYGLIFFEMLAGKLPYKSLNEAIRLKRDPNHIIPTPDLLIQGIDHKIVQLVEKCTSPNRENRYQNWDDVVLDLKNIVYPRHKKVTSPTTSKIVIVSSALSMTWKLLWPDDVDPQDGRAATKIELKLSGTFKIASDLYHLDKEIEALEIIDSTLKLPATISEAVNYLSRMSGIEGEAGREMLILKSKCYSAILEKRFDESMVIKAVNNGELLELLFPNDIGVMCLKAQAYIFAHDFEKANAILHKAEKISSEDNALRGTMAFMERAKQSYLMSCVSVHDLNQQIMNDFQRIYSYSDTVLWVQKYPSVKDEIFIRNLLVAYEQKVSESCKPIFYKRIEWLRENSQGWHVSLEKLALVSDLVLQANSLSEMREIATKYPIVVSLDFIDFNKSFLSKPMTLEIRSYLQIRFSWIETIQKEASTGRLTEKKDWRFWKK
jgi:serine/threonine protein kinase